ncbi:MAG: RNase adapter RapZ [Acidimicrobiia bacterium]|nr:RNase adapter RapZ [Acidimicrobiia bacterium]MYA39303.1 RNase adapter RapZ [Acidimicrobiia bacterium]MYD40547.1 RNase adapter RapZ [Acidimicrobiia bacterium]
MGRPRESHPERNPEVLLLTGMSGAGRGSMARVLEDLSYRVIDNLPPALILEVTSTDQRLRQTAPLALVIRSWDPSVSPDEAIGRAVEGLKESGMHTAVVFLDADDQVLIRRYEETRRPHPQGGETLPAAIGLERDLLSGLRSASDLIIDTSDFNIHQLRERVVARFGGEGKARPMHISMVSFGFKNGLPPDADVVFDVRFLPNPHWDPELRPRTGTDPEVASFVLENPDTEGFLERVSEMLLFLAPRYRAEGKAYLTIAVGCTGGRHRSVAVAGELARRLADHGVDISVFHRDAGSG